MPGTYLVKRSNAPVALTSSNYTSYASATAPINPVAWSTVWVDTSVTGQVTPKVYNGTDWEICATVIPPVTQDTSTSLTFVGYRFPVYGEALWTNVLRMLENFAAPFPPENPIVGQIWMDMTTSPGVPRVYNKQDTWEAIGAGLSIGSTPPDIPEVIDPLYPPDLWFDDTTNSLQYWDTSLNDWVGINCTLFASQIEYNALIDELAVVGPLVGVSVPTGKITTTAGSPNAHPTAAQWQLIFTAVQSIIAHIRDANVVAGVSAANNQFWVDAYATITSAIATGEDFIWCPAGVSSLHGMSVYVDYFDTMYAVFENTQTWIGAPDLSNTNPVNPVSFTKSSLIAIPGQAVTFTSTTVGATAWLWDFGNGIIRNTEGPHSINFPNPNTYTIALTASNTKSVGTGTDTITSYIKPTSSFTTSPSSLVAPSPLTVNFIDSSTNNPTSWLWTVTNNAGGAVIATRTTQNFQHTFATDGRFTVTLVASNEAGAAVNAATAQVITAQDPVASFTRTPSVPVVQPPLTVQFNDTSANTPTSWLWNFGDGATSTQQNPTHTYATSGVFDVTLTATNAVGTDTITMLDCVGTSIAPVANFSNTNAAGATPLTVTFTDTSTNIPTSWLWNFGDGATSTLQNPTHIYAVNGVYTVTLTATNAAGSNTKIATNLVSTQFDVNIILSADEQNVDIRAKLVDLGWNQVSPVVGSITINAGVVISASTTTQYALRTGGALPAGSNFSIINRGYIIGMGGAGGNGRTQVQVSAGKATTLQVTAYETSGSAGGPALKDDGGSAVPYKLYNYGIIGGGGGGGGGAASLSQLSSPGGGGGRTGRTNSAGGGGGYGSYSGTFAGPGGALVPGGHGNSGSGGGWGSGGAPGSAWPGDWTCSYGGGGGQAIVGSAGFTLPLGTWGTYYGAIA